ncbi:YbhB/YbcL family Raf kinase inhibitor-like protein [Microbacterium trichothecenolyticum]|uniref:Raf kinase inhibitor-like YbhB/YbcL family protein n=1 Tax=Microbacterium trichothecenolyticum TaxID=69370 RepID=A0ABU0TXW0_MICTR|nr:YbhB/YbcL family Raf kinase inhibitor-like protein [Microbacterium trichothecenolyticum]MDQ1124498.1 Raf kinase inhibitor-like YbhB/YbcL family protein [Microbacterium trichothecenolyticum]
MPLFIDKLAVSSPDFTPLSRIDDRFTAEGGHAVPRLRFEGAPEGTVELALICHDPDAPLPHGFTHWVVYGIPADAEEVDLDADGVRMAPNGAGYPVWYGPEPPVGHGEHHYYFWLYALSRPVEGTPTREEFLNTAGDTIIEQARTVATYSR